MYLFVEKMRTEQGSRMPQKTLDEVSGELPASPGGRTGVFTDPFGVYFRGTKVRGTRSLTLNSGPPRWGSWRLSPGAKAIFGAFQDVCSRGRETHSDSGFFNLRALFSRVAFFWSPYSFVHIYTQRPPPHK